MCRCQPLEKIFGNAGRHMKLASMPFLRAICLVAARNRIMVSAASKPCCGRNVNSHWLGPSSTSSERSGMPSASTPRRIGSASASTAWTNYYQGSWTTPSVPANFAITQMNGYYVVHASYGDAPNLRWIVGAAESAGRVKSH